MSEIIKEVTQDGATTTVRLSGEIDMHQAPEFHKGLVKICAGDLKQLVLDLSEVRYIDSSGVGTLVEVFRRLKKKNQTLVLLSPGERVRSVLEITRLDKFFTVAESESEIPAA